MLPDCLVHLMDHQRIKAEVFEQECDMDTVGCSSMSIAKHRAMAREYRCMTRGRILCLVAAEASLHRQ